MKARNKLLAGSYAALLTAFTGWLAADTFILPHDLVSAGEVNLSMFASETTAPDTAGRIPMHAGTPETNNMEASAAPPPAPEQPSADASAYADENVQITVQTYREYDTDIYVADVVLSSAAYLQTAFAEDTFGRNITAKTSEIAAAHNAVLAVNGDFCGARDTGVVIRNGILYRDAASSADLFCLFADGHAEIRSGSESGESLLAENVWQAWSFGPALLENGQTAVDTGDEVRQAMQSNPRTAFGVISDLHYVFVVADGRTATSAGLSLYELAGFMQGLGVQTAYNLDGGGSSSMVFNGKVINTPTTSGRRISERNVSDIIYIGGS